MSKLSKFKMLFMKACTVAVIGFLSCPFLIKTGKEIELFYKRLIWFLWTIVEGNEVIITLFSAGICLLGLFLILWVFRDDEGKAIKEKQEEVEE